MADSLPVTCRMEPGVQRASPEGFSLADIAIEIRHMIYNAINEPRMVEIHYNDTLSSVWSPTKVPMGLHICKESREEAKRHYHYGFCGTDNKPRVWFDFRCDSLYFSTYCLSVNIDCLAYLLIHFTDEEDEGIKHLSIDYNLMVALSAQLAADVELIEEENGDPWDATLILIPMLHRLEQLTVNLANNRGFMGSRFDADDVSMLVELCERARDEELGKWKMPLMGRVSDRNLSTWVPICEGTGVKDVSVFMTGDDAKDKTDAPEADVIAAAIALVANGS